MEIQKKTWTILEILLEFYTTSLPASNFPFQCHFRIKRSSQILTSVQRGYGLQKPNSKSIF